MNTFSVKMAKMATTMTAVKTTVTTHAVVVPNVVVRV